MGNRRSSASRRYMIVLAVGLQLAACATAPETTSAAHPPPPAPPAAWTPAVPPPKPAPQPPSKRIPVPPPKPAPPEPGNPDELINLNEEAVIRLLGPPATTHNDGAARILSYQSDGCGLDVILFLDVKDGTLRVLSYQLNDSRGQGAKVAACYDELRSTRQ